MKIAVIEDRLKDYVADVFCRHPDSQLELASFLDWKPQQETYREIPIGKIEEADSGKYDAILIAIRDNRYLSRLLTWLHKRHIGNVYVVRLFALDMREDFIIEEPPYFDSLRVDKMPSEHQKPYLVHLETHVCDHCNLNCKACNNFSPFVEEPSYADIDRFERDLQSLTGLFSGIGRFFLLGGEPLLAPELCCEMIRCYRKYFLANELRVLTNATLILSMKDEFWECIRENEVIIHISLYPPVKERIDKIREKLEQENVRYLVFREVKSFVKHWTAYPFEDENYNNEYCGSAGCHYLRDGKISKCPDAMLVDSMSEKDKSLSLPESEDRIKLSEESDAWEIIERLDNAIDMCKSCTYRRAEAISWERVEGAAQPSDWLLPHKYEAEVEKAFHETERVKVELQKAENEIKKVKAEAQKAEKEIKMLSGIIEEWHKQIRSDKENIDAGKERENRLKEELGIWKKRYDSVNNSLKNIQWEYERVNNSYSHKIGRAITWLPRKVRKTAQICGGGVLKKLKESGLYKINDLFKREVLKGFEEYGKIVNEYGSDVVVFATAWRGTGDYFICGLYLEEYLKVNNIDNYVFLIPDSGGEPKVTELFEVYHKHTVEMKRITPMNILAAFSFQKNRQIRYLHHGNQNFHNRSISISDIELAGYKGLHMIDFYLCYGFMLPEHAPKSIPYFDREENIINEMFEENHLIKGKTVLIAPYSTGLKQYELPEKFWVELTFHLKERGYTVATNCVGKEKCISGTVAMNIPYKQTVPFVERAGYFIGIRSGLCDILAGAYCKKIIFHTYRATWWKDGMSIPYTGLNNMGLCDDAVEFEYRNGEETKALLKIALENLF
ncbi:MAG: hypothetical protein NC337_06995 [Roseburia sp.]|nr:hypothetical protein [Roseburia sp.]